MNDQVLQDIAMMLSQGRITGQDCDHDVIHTTVDPTSITEELEGEDGSSTDGEEDDPKKGRGGAITWHKRMTSDDEDSAEMWIENNTYGIMR
ncbi:hypothetical protein Pmar_PMAR010304 [Perkinsus marinus ATCC 50983]|uniref:Uncharacterized protein n=1 Tax=Perkinsus marinus (strain ATCC 50983 / TXsc) TaxID=423536 RepID=C5K5D5_PERM5|nr:hypothetical protein Pmar_PMAR010304 [Perkinsus marinus ATCC 50983]EER20557.1 hypothetical protein Pmar_PMAR010304 [Perkinsus marinus ATCC 50983]|eukprot:XP_002788761.1 hypothetical protein Pmar_PMAR010304 [Perkinsus marinus ATCC 50983]